MKSLILTTVTHVTRLATLLLLAQSSYATDANISIPATVTVNATITLTPGTDMDFGQFYMTGITGAETVGVGAINGVSTPNDSAYIELLPNGTLISVDGNSSKASSVIGPGVPGTFSITGAALSTAVKFTSPELIDGDVASAGTRPFSSGGGDIITFTDLTIDTDGDGTADNDLAVTGDGAVVNGVTDAAGALTVSTGGRIYSTYIDTTDNNLYDAGAYTGTYTVTVSY